MKKIFLTAALVVLTLAIIGVFAATRPRPKPDQIEVTLWNIGCPLRPEPNEMAVMVNCVLPTLREITFDGPQELIDDLEDFGDILWNVFDLEYRLAVSRQYNFGEVAHYIEAWQECHEIANFHIDGRIEVDESVPTLPLEPGEVRIHSGYVDYGNTCAYEDGQYYVVPSCQTWNASGTSVTVDACPIEQGYPVEAETYQECLDIAWGRNTPMPTATPTPEDVLFLDEEVLFLPSTPIPPNTPAIKATATLIPEGCWWLGTEVVCLSTPGISERISGTSTPAPTIAPSLVIQPYDQFESLDKLIHDLIIIALATEYTFVPNTTDAELLIDWPHTIFITDAFLQTTVIAGPATVRFANE